MSDTLRELLVEISYKDKASPSLENVDRKVDSLKDSFGAMGKAVARNTTGIVDLGSRTNKTSKDLERIDKRHKLWQQTASGMERVLHSNSRESETLRSKINVLDREINVSNKSLEKTKKLYGDNSKQALAYKDHIQDLQLQHSKLNKELNGLGAARLGSDLTTAGNAMTSAGGWMTRNLSLPIAVAAGASVKTFVTLEEAFSDVSKTFRGTDEQLKKTRKELDFMASNTIPVARKELYGIAANAGQLGVGAKNVVGFTDTIAKLGATTNLTYDTASSDIAQFANITKMSLDDVGRLGSTIVELGNNTETFENDILNMSMRIGAAGNQVKMSQAEIIGLAAGMSSLGMEAEAGGTAVSKLLYDMQEATMTGSKQLGKYAKVAGLTGKEFKKAFEDNASNALVLFTQGLGEMQKEGKNVIGTLNDMGLNNERLRDAVLRAAGSNDVLNRTINMGNIAWEQNIALNEEFANKSKTSASNIQLMKSKVEEVGNAFGEHLIPHINNGLDLVTKMTNKFGEMSPKTQSNIFNGLIGVAIAGPVIKKIGTLTKGLGELNNVVATAGGWGPYLAGAGASLGAFITGPVGIAILGIGSLAAVIGLVAANWDKLEKGKFLTNVGGKYSYGGPNTTHLNAGTNKIKEVPTTPSFNSNQWNRVIGSNALGTNYWRGGATELGERGIELVIGRQTRNLSNGAKVINNRDTENLLSRESKTVVVEETTFAPILNVYLTDGNKQEFDKAKEALKREFDDLMEDFFYRYRKKLASAN